MALTVAEKQEKLLMGFGKFVCPHCNTPLRFDLELTNLRQDDELPPPGPDDWKQSLTPEQIGAVEQAKKNGLFSAFEAVLPHMRGSAPKYPEKFLVTFFHTIKQKRIPYFALNTFWEKFGGEITFWSAQGIGLVVSDGHPVYFVPLHLVAGETLRSVGGGNKMRLSAEADPLKDWLRTPMGYCPRNSLMLDELRRKSIGEFANPAV